MPTVKPNARGIKPRKNDRCDKCKCLCPDFYRLSRVDESNHAITRNAREYCPDCWLKKHPRDAFDPYFANVFKRWISFLRSKA